MNNCKRCKRDIAAAQFFSTKELEFCSKDCEIMYRWKWDYKKWEDLFNQMFWNLNHK